MPSIFQRTHPLFQPREIRPEELRWILRRNISTSVLGSVSVSYVTSGVFFTAFGQEMGMTKYHFGVLGTVLAAMGLMRLFASAIEERAMSRKYPWFILVTLSRFVLVPFVLGLFMRINPWAIIALMAFHTALLKLAAPMWQSWTWGYIPSGTFAGFWAKRQFWLRLSNTAFGLGAAVLFDRVPEQYRRQALSVLFAVLIAVGFLHVLCHVRIPEPLRTAPPSGSLSKIADVFRNRPFRNLVLVAGLWSFAAMISGPFTNPYMLEDLGLGRNLLIPVVLNQVVPTAGALLALRFWGRTLDTRHPGVVMTLCGAFWCTIPLFFYLANPNDRTGVICLLAAARVVGGIFPVGFGLAKVLLAARMSGEDKTMPAAVIFAMQGVGGMLGAAVGTYFISTAEARGVFALSFAVRVIVVFVAFLLLVRSGKGSAAAAAAGASSDRASGVRAG